MLYFFIKVIYLFSNNLHKFWDIFIIQLTVLTGGRMMQKKGGKNGQNALIYLLSGVGLILLLGSVFRLYNVSYGLMAAFLLWIISGAIGKPVIGVIGSIGLILLMVGTFHYSLAYVLLGTIAIWVAAGTFGRYSHIG